MEELSDEQILVALNHFYIENENNVKTEAKVKRAYISKMSEDIIQEKVNNQLNAIKTGIYEINPRFKEGSKNFDKTKSQVLETVANYEKALIDLSNFYDGKIEQLILKKVELEAGLIGSILNDEYLHNVIVETEKRKKNDKVKNTVKENFALALGKLLKKKEENKAADPKVIIQLIDSNDVENEIEESIVAKFEKTTNRRSENKEFIANAEKQISMINDEIERLNERKNKNIYDAMEIGDKALATNIRRPKAFAKITRFFIGRFNTSKVVENTILDPLRLRIESFRNNELSNIQG